MNVAFACPECQTTVRADLGAGAAAISCPQCDRETAIPAEAIDGANVRRCVACGCSDLFVRKDFPQRLGVVIVTLGLLASCVAWGFGRLYWTFGILFATALIDVVLYVVVPNALMCYRCGAMYRGVADLDQHSSFHLETHERHRQQSIRLAAAKNAKQQTGV